MAIVALITREPPLTLDEWLSCIAVTPELVPPAPRTVLNPFTRRPYLHLPAAGDVDIILPGLEAESSIESGSEFAQDATLAVNGPDEGVSPGTRALILRVAASMRAPVEWLV
jgi:hypothetical protein